MTLQSKLKSARLTCRKPDIIWLSRSNLVRIQLMRPTIAWNVRIPLPLFPLHGPTDRGNTSVEKRNSGSRWSVDSLGSICRQYCGGGIPCPPAYNSISNVSPRCNNWDDSTTTAAQQTKETHLGQIVAFFPLTKNALWRWLLRPLWIPRTQPWSI